MNKKKDKRHHKKRWKRQIKEWIKRRVGDDKWDNSVEPDKQSKYNPYHW